MTAAGFRTRKIAPPQKTLGDLLKCARRQRRASVRQAEEATHIRAKWLLALESDAWEQLPSEVYGRGYLFQYADYLGLSRKTVEEQYDRERCVLLQRCERAREASGLSIKSSVRIPKFYITTRLISYLASATVLLVIGGYLVWQVNRFSSVPLLEIAQPVAATDGAMVGVVVLTDSVTVTGHTTVGATVSINNQSIMVDGSGLFRQNLELARGENLIHITATNRSGATRQEVLRVEAQY
jgi:hypothetical protein